MKKILAMALLSVSLMAEAQLKVASYNVDNLFDLNEKGSEYKEYRSSKSNWNKRNYKAKLKHISKVIKLIDADIIALEEVESLQALKDLRLTLKQNSLYYKYFAIASKKDTTVKVALLSKIPYIYAKSLRIGSSPRYRDILEVKFQTKQMKKPLYLFINHWKAKSGPESQRIVSARALRKRIEQLGYDKDIVLVGDFNSDYEEYKKFKRVRRLNDTGGKTGINHILKTTYQTKPFSCSMQKVKKSFYNLWYDVKPKERFSYIFRGKKEALDNILVSQSLLDCKKTHYKKGSMHSYKANFLFHGKRINRWQIRGKRNPKHTAKGYSDHLPVSAEFILK